MTPRLIVPYTLDANDMRFGLPQGFSQAEDFFVYLRDSFDALSKSTLALATPLQPEYAYISPGA